MNHLKLPSDIYDIYDQLYANPATRELAEELVYITSRGIPVRTAVIWIVTALLDGMIGEVIGVVGLLINLL